MEGPEATQLEQQAIKWRKQAQNLVGLFEGLLHENERLRADVEKAERECARLRQDISRLQVQLMNETIAKLRGLTNEVGKNLRGAKRSNPFEHPSSQPNQIEQIEGEGKEPPHRLCEL